MDFIWILKIHFKYATIFSVISNSSYIKLIAVLPPFEIMRWQELRHCPSIQIIGINVAVLANA
jgi:hypothetical protein